MNYTKLLMLISLISANVFAVSTSIAKLKKYPLRVSLDINSKLNGNLDEHVLNGKTGEDIQTTNISLAISKRFKLPSKVKLNSKTSAEMTLLNKDQGYKNTEIINKDNINLSTRKLKFSQNLALSKKINKKVSLNGLLDIELNNGNSIEQEFIESAINYYAIDSSFIKNSLAFGGRYKFNRTHSTQTLYRLSDFDYKKDAYTFKEDQGSNDRRIHSIGVQHKIKTKQKQLFIFAVQRDQIFYRDRLSLDNQGNFRETGLANISQLEDKTLKFGLLSAKKIFTLEIAGTERTDKIENGDGYTLVKYKLGHNGRISKLTYSFNFTKSAQVYSAQLASNTIDKRLDSTERLNSKFSYNFNKIQANLMLSRTVALSNNKFGDLDYNTLEVGLKTNF
jgi:hypothetical protein